jgi:hypothetical protein
MALDHPEYVPKSARPMKFFLVTVTKWCPVLRRGTTVAMAEAKPGAAGAHDPRITRYGPALEGMLGTVYTVPAATRV